MKSDRETFEKNLNFTNQLVESFKFFEDENELLDYGKAVFSTKKYPAQFEHFTPVCKSVELSNCSQAELINAYDNSIVYTDYILHKTIESLKQLNT
jgi:hypothetical protein